MPRTWTSSPEVHLDIDLDRPRGRRSALEQALRDAIHAGRLNGGSVLPSSRGLARDLGISRGTVVEAYAQLQAEGYLLTRPGGATTVAETGQTAVAPRPSRPAGAPRVRFDLRPGLLDLAATFPRADWSKSVRSALHCAPDSAFDYGDPRGRPELRAALTRYLARARGVVTSPDHVVICLGFAHGLSILTEALRANGVRTCAMEDPCLPMHRDVVRRAGLDVVPLAVDDDGAQGALLDGLHAHAAIVTPAHQYPTGVTLHPSRRAQLVAWARRTGGLVIEDDYDGEFRYDRQPVGALQGLDPDHIAYLGTTSKTIAPGMRIGWMVVPPRLVDAMIDVNDTFRGGAVPSALEQLALADFIERGQLDRHLRRLRASYRKRRDAMVTAIAQSLPSLTMTGVSAGLHVLVELTGSDTTESEVRRAADERGVTLAYLRRHWHAERGHREGVLVGYARPSASEFDDAVAAVIDILLAAVAGC